MSSIAHRLWNTTPKHLWEAVDRRIRPGRHRAVQPDWHTVQGGPIRGAKLYLAPTAVDTWAQMVQGTFDQFFLDALVATRPLEGTTLWDIGSHFGYHALAFAALAGTKGKVIAFEPNPANQERIRANFEKNPELSCRIQLDPRAVSKSAGTAAFVFADELESGLSSGSHLADITTPHGDYARFRRSEIPTIRIDDLIFSENKPVPDVIKIDVEGAETMVLEGSMQFFAKHHPVLLIEVHHILQMFRVQNFLTERGYAIAILDEEHATPGRCFILAK